MALIEKGFAKVHFTAERSPFYQQMLTAEESAKSQKLNVCINAYTYEWSLT